MRAIVLLPLIAAVATVAGCNSQAKLPTTGALPERDLTVPSQDRGLEVASPVELGKVRPPQETIGSSHRASRRSRTIHPQIVPAAMTVPAPVLARSTPAAQPATTPAQPVDSHELLPGKTVTVIPVSTGPSTAADPSDDIPESGGHTLMGETGGSGMGGGRCHGGDRGPDIGFGGPPPLVLR